VKAATRPTVDPKPRTPAEPVLVVEVCVEVLVVDTAAPGVDGLELDVVVVVLGALVVVAVVLVDPQPPQGRHVASRQVAVPIVWVELEVVVVVAEVVGGLDVV